MKKRLFAIMLALAMLLAAVPALAEEGKIEEQNQVQEKIFCATEGCTNEVANKGDFCKDCATAKKVAEEEAAAKKAAEEEALRKAAEEAAKKAAEGKTEGLKATPGETNQAGTGADGNCHHNHTAAWASTQTGVQGTMVEHPAKDPTCTSEGNIKYYTCTNCGRYFRRDESIKEKIVATETSADEVKIQKISHKLNKVNGQPATCTKAGNIEYYVCSVCQGKFKDEKGEIPVNDVVIPALGHDYDDPTWNWCGVSSAIATFKCKRNCKEKNAIVTCQVRPTRSSINNCGYYTYTATVKFNDKTYTNTRTDYSCRPDWYYDPCYYNNPCGHWGCGNVCTRYSNCVPCQNYRTTFRVGGYNCLATPKTGDVSVMAPAMLALIGAAGAALGKKRR